MPYAKFLLHVLCFFIFETSFCFLAQHNGWDFPNRSAYPLVIVQLSSFSPQIKINRSVTFALFLRLFCPYWYIERLIDFA